MTTEVFMCEPSEIKIIVKILFILLFLRVHTWRLQLSSWLVKTLKISIMQLRFPWLWAQHTICLCHTWKKGWFHLLIPIQLGGTSCHSDDSCYFWVNHNFMFCLAIHWLCLWLQMQKWTFWLPVASTIYPCTIYPGQGQTHSITIISSCLTPFYLSAGQI